MGSVMTFDGGEMTESPMPSGADVDVLVFVVTVEREVAVVNESSMLSGGKDEKLFTRSSCRTR